MLSDICNSPDSDTVWTTGKSDILVRALAHTKALHKLADGFDHTSPVISIPFLHLFHYEFSLCILAIKALGLHEYGDFCRTQFELFGHSRCLYINSVS